MTASKYILCAGALSILASAGLHALPQHYGQDPFREAEPAASCPQLFGDEEARELNHQSRRELLLSVRREEHCHVVQHSTDWRAPQVTEYIGLTLLQTRIDDESGPRALVRVSAEIDELSCEPGLYLITADDSIGNEVRVLAILRDLVLVEDSGELRYLALAGIERPVWRMVWVSSWTMPRLPGSRVDVRRPAVKSQRPARPTTKPPARRR